MMTLLWGVATAASLNRFPYKLTNIEYIMKEEKQLISHTIGFAACWLLIVCRRKSKKRKKKLKHKPQKYSVMIKWKDQRWSPPKTKADLQNWTSLKISLKSNWRQLMVCNNERSSWWNSIEQSDSKMNVNKISNKRTTILWRTLCRVK